MAAYSLLALRQALAEEAFSGQYPIRALTTAAGSASSVVIGAIAFGTSGATVNDYHGCWLYNTHSTITAPFSSRVLQQVGFAPTTGTLTVAPAFGSIPGSSMEIIFCYDLHPDELHRAINRILRNLIHYAYLPVTLCPDGDMEDTGVTLWNPIGASTTIAKAATTRFLFGRQMLNVVVAAGGAANDGVGSSSIPVVAGEPLVLSVPIWINSGANVTVQLFNVVGGTVIDSATVTAEENPVTVQFSADAPSGAENVTVRFLVSAASTDFNVGPVSLLSQKRKRYALDTGSIERSADVKDLFKISQGQNATVADTFYSFSEENQESDYIVEEDLRAGTPLNIVLPKFPTQPYFMRVQKRFPELSTSSVDINGTTNTTTADRDTVVQGAMHYIERARYGRMVGSNPQIAAVHLGRSREYARKFAMMRQAQGYGIVAREITPARTTVAMS